MDHRDLSSALSRGAVNRRTTRVGIEHELLVRDLRTGGTVAPDRLRASGPTTHTSSTSRSSPAGRSS